MTVAVVESLPISTGDLSQTRDSDGSAQHSRVPAARPRASCGLLLSPFYPMPGSRLVLQPLTTAIDFAPELAQVTGTGQVFII